MSYARTSSGFTQGREGFGSETRERRERVESARRSDARLSLGRATLGTRKEGQFLSASPKKGLVAKLRKLATGEPGEKASRGGRKSPRPRRGSGSTAAAHAPPLFLGLASRAQVVHEVFLGQRRGDGAGLRDRGDDACRPATVPGRHAGVSEGRIVSPGRTDARGVRQARGRRVRGAAHVRRVASSNRAVDGRSMNVRWVVRNARRHLRISIA